MSQSTKAGNVVPSPAPPDPPAPPRAPSIMPWQNTSSATSAQELGEQNRTVIGQTYPNARAHPVDPWGHLIDLPRAFIEANEWIDHPILQTPAPPAKDDLRRTRQLTRERAYAMLHAKPYTYASIALTQWLPFETALPLDQAYSTYCVWDGETAKGDHKLRSTARGYPHAVEPGVAVDPPRHVPKPATPSTASTRGDHSSSVPRGGPSSRARGNSRGGGTHQSLKPVNTGESNRATPRSTGRGSGRGRGNRSRGQRVGVTNNAETDLVRLQINPNNGERLDMEGVQNPLAMAPGPSHASCTTRQAPKPTGSDYDLSKRQIVRKYQKQLTEKDEVISDLREQLASGQGRQTPASAMNPKTALPRDGPPAPPAPMVTTTLSGGHQAQASGSTDVVQSEDGVPFHDDVVQSSDEYDSDDATAQQGMVADIGKAAGNPKKRRQSGKDPAAKRTRRGSGNEWLIWPSRYQLT